MAIEHRLSYTATEVDDKLRAVGQLLEDVESLEGRVGGIEDEYVSQSDIGIIATKNIVEKTDLASNVQESLNKADSALQFYHESDPTVPAWAKAPTKPTYTFSEVGAMPVVPVTADDDGKFLRVVNGMWAATVVQSAEEVDF